MTIAVTENEVGGTDTPFTTNFFKKKYFKKTLKQTRKELMTPLRNKNIFWSIIFYPKYRAANLPIFYESRWLMQQYCWLTPNLTSKIWVGRWAVG